MNNSSNGSLAGWSIAIDYKYKFTWTGTGANNTLTTAANWDDNIKPITDAEIELTFAGNTNLNPVMDSDMRYTSIAFDLTAGAFNIGGSGQFTLDKIINENTANLQTIANRIGIVSGTLTVDGVQDSNTALNGVISGAGSILKTGDGTLTLNAVNTYTGTTLVEQGTLVAGVADAIALANLDIASGATLSALANQSFATLTGFGTLEANNNAITSRGGDASNLVFDQVGAFVVNTDSEVILGNGQTVDALDVQAGALTISPENSTLIVTTDATFAASTTLNLGHTLADGTPALDIGGAMTIDTDNTTLNLTSNYDGGSELTTLPSGTYPFTAPTVTLVTATGGITGDFANITIGGNALSDTVTINEFADATIQKVPNDAGAGDSLVAQIGLYWYNTANNTAHGTFNITDGNLFEIKSALVDNALATAWYTDPAGNTWDGKSLTKTEAGTLVLSASNSYTGTTLITGGTLVAKNVHATGTGNVTNNAMFNLDLAAAASGTYTNDILGTGTTLKTGAGELTTTGNIANLVQINDGNYTNEGVVDTTGNLDETTAVRVNTASVLTNTGYIEGRHTGVEFTADAEGAHLFNTGTIRAVLGSNAVISATSILVTNTAAGWIDGTDYAVWLQGGGTVANHGLITGGTTGVQLDAGGEIINSGTISGAANAGIYSQGVVTIANEPTGLISGGSTGVYLSDGEVINTGTITGTTAAGGGVYATNSVLVENITDDALITGGNYGIYLAGGGEVHNFGTISGTSSASYGVYAGASALVENDSTAFIQGGNSGVYLVDGGTVTNSGAITGTDAIQGVGIIAASAPIITTNSGLIEGGRNGMDLYVGGTVNNTGTIAGLSRHGLWSGNGPSTVDNAATGLITGGMFGVVLNSGGTVTNSGTIIGTTENGIHAGQRAIITNAPGGLIEGAANGITLLAGGEITNDGLITGGATGIQLDAGGEITNTGTIRGTDATNGVGVRADNTPALVTNNAGGLIEGGRQGVYLVQGGTVTNSGSIFSNNGDGISTENTPVSITNNATGIIQGGATGVRLAAGGTITNDGLITGGDKALDLTGIVQVFNSGTISGATGLLGGTAGDDQILLITGDGLWTNTGDITIGGNGAATLELRDNATVTAGQTATIGATGTLIVGKGATAYGSTLTADWLVFEDGASAIFDLTGIAADSGSPLLNLGINAASGSSALLIRNDTGELDYGIYDLVKLGAGNPVPLFSAPLFNGELIARSSRDVNALFLYTNSAAPNTLIQLVAANTGTAMDLVWTGAITGGIWRNDGGTGSNNEILNWAGEALPGVTVPLAFMDNDRVRFDDTATGTTDVDIVGTVQVAAITVDTSTNTYTFQGAGAITGTAADVAFEKSGTATLTIANSNILSSFTGTIVLHDDGGTLKLSEAATLASAAALTLGSNATLDTAGAAQTLNALYGTGTIFSEGATLTINTGSFGGSILNLAADTVVKDTLATLTYTNIEALGTGSTIIQGGVLELRDIAGHTDASNQKTIVLAGGWLDLSDNPVHISPDADLSDAYHWDALSLVNNDAGGTGGVIGVNDVVTITASDYEWHVVDGVKKGVYVVVNAGDGVAKLADDNDYAGTTRLFSGTLDLSGNTQIGDTALARNVIFAGGNLLVSADVDASARSLDMRADGTLAVADGVQTHWKTLLDGTGSGIAALTKAGPGALFFDDAVDYAGAINATGGLLEFLSTAALGELNIATGGTTTFDEDSTVADLAVEDAAGILIADAKTLTLTATGTIGATTVRGATATLVNQGVLSAAAAHIEGNFTNALAATGTVKSIGQNLDNAGLLTIVTGTVGGTSAFNTGTITGAPIGILATNANILVTNTGAGLIEGALRGVHLTAGGTVVNSSTIRGANDSSRGIYADAIATVTNSLGGLIEGNYEGVNLNAGGTVTNSGIIRGYGSMGDGVYSSNASSDITVTNNSTGLIEGTWNGIYTNDTLAVLNSGTIIGLTRSGIHAGGRAVVTNTTGGLISGVSAGYYAIELAADAANEVHLWNSSTIDGNLHIAGVASLLTLNGDHTGAQLYSDAVTGETTFTGTLLKLGLGTWEIDSATANLAGLQQAATLVQAGTLAVQWDKHQLNETATALVDVASGATLHIKQNDDGDTYLANRFTGAGYIDYEYTGVSGTSYVWHEEPATLMSSFTGTFGVRGTTNTAHYVLDDIDEEALVNTTLRLGVNGQTQIDGHDRSIGGLDLAGGLLIVRANPDVPVTPYKLTVNTLMGNTGTIGVDTDILSGINPPMPPGDGLSGNIFDLDVLPPDYKLNERIIVDSTVSGPADGIAFDLVDSNGNTLASGTDNTTVTYGQNGITPVGQNTYGYNAITQGGDLLLNYGLVSIEALHETESLIIDPGAAADGTLSAKLTGDGAAGFTFTGTRIITLGHTGNDYTGATLITGSATLTALDGLNNIIATSTAVTITADAAFDLNDTAQTLRNLSGAGSIHLTDGALTVANTQTGLIFSGVIDGAGSLTLAANSAWTLTGNNTYTGPTAIEAGAHLQLGDGGATGILADASPVANSGTLAINRSDDLVYGGTVTGAGSLIQRGEGTTTLTGANNLTGGIIVEQGVLQIGQNDATGWIPAIASNAAIASGAELRINRADLVTYSGVISGAGDFSAIGTGTTVLTKAQTLTGATRVENGTLRLTATNALSTSSGVTLADATLDLGGVAQTLKKLHADNGVIRYNTPGASTTYNRLTISGSYTGETTSYMNVDLVNRQTNFLQVNGIAAGTHEVVFNSTNDTPLDDTERKYALEVISTGAGSTATFSSNGIESGMHTCQLYQGDGGLILPNKTSWYLSGGDARSRAADAILLTAGLMGADWHYSLDSVHKRLGDIRADIPADTGSVWARANAYRLNASSDLGGSAVQQDTYAITAGADKVFRREKALLAAGAYLGMGHSSRTFDDIRNQYGDGKSSTAGIGLYALWLYDNAWYLDATLKFDRHSHELNARGVDGFVSRGKYTTKTQGISIETGRRLTKGRYWVEPSAQVAVAWINGADYTVSNGVSRDLEIHVGDSDAWQYRGQIRSGADLGQWRPYAKIAIVKSDTNGGEVTADGRRYELWFDGWRLEAGAGVSYLIDARSQVYLDYEYAKARYYERPWSFNLGYRRVW